MRDAATMTRTPEPVVLAELLWLARPSQPADLSAAPLARLCRQQGWTVMADKLGTPDHAAVELLAEVAADPAYLTFVVEQGRLSLARRQEHAARSDEFAAQGHTSDIGHIPHLDW